MMSQHAKRTVVDRLVDGWIVLAIGIAICAACHLVSSFDMNKTAVTSNKEQTK